MVEVRIIVRGMKENFSMEVCKECSTERIVYCYFLRHNMWLYCLNNVGDDFHILSTNNLRKQKNPMCLYGGVYKFKMVYLKGINRINVFFSLGYVRERGVYI